MQEYEHWKSLVDLQEYPALPDSELLDDFADSPSVTSSEITDRDTFENTGYQGDTNDNFSPVGSRPDWIIETGSASVNDDGEYLELPSDRNHITHSDTEFEFGVPDSGTLHIKVDLQAPTSTGTGRWGFGYLAQQTSSTSEGAGSTYDESYAIWLNDHDDQGGQLRKITSSSGVENLLSGRYDSGTDEFTVKIEIDADTSPPTHSVTANGNSWGSVQDGDFTDEGAFVIWNDLEAESQYSDIQVWIEDE